MDIWRVLRPQANDREMLIVGRVVVVVMVGVGIAWMPNVQRKFIRIIGQAYSSSMFALPEKFTSVSFEAAFCDILI